jgi:hypothetical protein
VEFNGYLVTLSALFLSPSPMLFFGMPTITVDKPTFRMFTLKINMEKKYIFIPFHLSFFSISPSREASLDYRLT